MNSILEYSQLPLKIICELDRESGQRRFALLGKGDEPLEFIFPSNDEYGIGSVCVGRIQKKLLNTGSYFVSIGKNKTGFLPVKYQDNFTEGQKVLVQVVKAAYGIKDAKLSLNIEPEILAKVEENFKDADCVGVLLPAPDVLEVLVKENFMTLQKIICNDLADGRIVRNLLTELGRTEPEVVMHNCKRGGAGLFDDFGLNDVLAEIENPCFVAKEGYRLFFEKTEAFWTIDVDSYTCLLPFDKINELAAQEILKQIRLRNLSGQIVIDFISNRNHRISNKVVSIFKEELPKGRVNAFLAGVSPLGHIEIIRSRN